MLGAAVWAIAAPDMAPTVAARSSASFQLRPCISSSFRGEKLVAVARLDAPSAATGPLVEGFKDLAEMGAARGRRAGLRGRSGRYGKCQVRSRLRDRRVITVRAETHHPWWTTPFNPDTANEGMSASQSGRALGRTSAARPTGQCPLDRASIRRLIHTRAESHVAIIT